MTDAAIAIAFAATANISKNRANEPIWIGFDQAGDGSDHAVAAVVESSTGRPDDQWQILCMSFFPALEAVDGAQKKFSAEIN